MGLSKGLMYDASELTISFDCPNPACHQHIAADVEDASFDWSSDRLSDGISTVVSDISCDSCGKSYRIEVIANAGQKEVIVQDFPNLRVEFSDNTFDLVLEGENEYDEFLAEYEPDEPYNVYRKSIDELLDLDYGSTIYSTAKDAFLKMLYLQYVVVLEAYLSDRLIKIISNDNEKLTSLVGSCAALREQTPKLIEVAKDADFVKKQAKAYLQHFSFHNLLAIAPFFRAVLNVEIFEDDIHKKELLEVIEKRHHLAHRNGRDNDGKTLAIDDAAIQHLKELVGRTVERIEVANVEYRRKAMLV